MIALDIELPSLEKVSMERLDAFSIPILVRPDDPVLGNSFDETRKWFFDCKEQIGELLARYGCLLFRGFALRSTEEFSVISSIFPPHKLGYLGGATPRSSIYGNVFEATRVAPPFKIQLHQEMSYLPHHPARLMFYCHIAPDVDGETIIADMRRITAMIPARVHEAFSGRRIRYERNFSNHRNRSDSVHLQWLQDFHRSWKDSFGTEDENEVEQACRNMGLPYQWEADGSLTITYVADPYYHVPRTDEKIWFNHIATLHNNPRSMGKAAVFLGLYQRAGRRLPNVVTFEDGEPLSEDLVYAILDVLEEETVAFPWHTGDLMIVDNILVAHGRNSFSGPRDIQVTLHD